MCLSRAVSGRRRLRRPEPHAMPTTTIPLFASGRKTRPGIQYVAGSGVDLPGATVTMPRKTWAFQGLLVKTTGSTDEGVGLLMTVYGVTLCHVGDHARWADSLEEDFMQEMRWLSTNGPRIDVALFPVATGMVCDPRVSIWQGVRAAAALLAPRVLTPMHVGCPDRFDLYARFQAEVGSDLPGTQVVAPSRRAEVFWYTAGAATLVR